MKTYQVYESGFIVDSSAAACCALHRFKAVWNAHYFECSVERAQLTGPMPSGPFKWIVANDLKEAVRKFVSV